ncbi:MAG: DMT family transporter [Microscillaceae bacterium]|nr:DMT family transporter [Microscillaceae bacterium]
MNQMFKVHLALFTVNLLFSINYVLAKILTPEYILPFAIIVFRVWGSAILFWLLHAWTIKEKVQSKEDFLNLAYCALFGVVLNQLSFFKGLSLSSAISTSIIMTLTPILVLIISVFILGERITLQKLFGIFLGCLGAYLLVGGGSLSLGNKTMLGDFLLLANAFFYAIYLVIMKPLMRRYHALTVVKWTFIFGAIGVLPFGLPEIWVLEWSRVPWYGYMILFYIVIGVTFFAYLLSAWGLAYVNSSVVGYYIYLQPVLTSIIAIIFGREYLGWDKVIFCLMIFMGVYLVSKEKSIKIVKLAE